MDHSAAGGGRVLTGMEECSIDDVGEPTGARFVADEGHGSGNGGFEAGPLGTAEDAEMAGRLVPLDDQTGVGRGPRRVTRIPAEELFREMEAPAARVDAGTLETFPEVPQRQQQPESDI